MSLNSIRHKRSDSGVALLFVLFLMLLVLIGASVAILRFENQGLRQKEAVMIWRGQQYERAIGLYYRKFGRFPTSIDELLKGVNGVRFLREEYKDPMNREDGSWRLVYVTPAGQLIGSVRYVTLQQMALADRARIMGISLDQETGSENGEGISPVTPPGTDQNGTGATLGSPSAIGSGTGGTTGAPQTDQNGQQPNPPQPAPPQPNPFGISPQANQLELQTAENTGEVVGGFIVGVASKIDKPSLKVYKGGTTYKQWEFIYNPLEQVQTFGGASLIGTIGTNPMGPQPSAPVSPQPPKPPQIPQSPQQ
jgi:hypothetical protein